MQQPGNNDSDERRGRRDQVQRRLNQFRELVNSVCGAIEHFDDLSDAVLDIGSYIEQTEAKEFLSGRIHRNLTRTLKWTKKANLESNTLLDICGRLQESLDYADAILSKDASLLDRIADHVADKLLEKAIDPVVDFSIGTANSAGHGLTVAAKVVINLGVVKVGIVVSVSVAGGGAVVDCAVNDCETIKWLIPGPPVVATVEAYVDAAVMEVDERQQADADVYRGDRFLPDAQVEWTSDDPRIATVSTTGRVVAVSPGDVSIYARYNESISNAVRITVVLVPVVIPSVDVGLNLSVEEGDTITAFGSFADSDSTGWTATVDYGDGTTGGLALSPEKTFVLNHRYDSAGDYIVTVAVTDDGRNVGDDSLRVSVEPAVDNPPVVPVNPMVLPGADVVIDEGELFTPDGSFSDSDSTTWTATVNYGEGGTRDLILDQSSRTFRLTHRYQTTGEYEVEVIVTDEGGRSGSDSITVTVIGNKAPIVEIEDHFDVSDGGLFRGSGSFTDPDSMSWTATVNYGEGGTRVLILDLSDKTFSLTHSYQTAGDHKVEVIVTDERGRSGRDSITVTVIDNKAPIVGIDDNFEMSVDGLLQGSGSFTDPDSTSWTATVDYDDDDGTIEELALDLPEMTFELLHSYQLEGAHTVEVRVFDDKGGVGRAFVEIDVGDLGRPPIVFIDLTFEVADDGTLRGSGSFTDPDSTSWTATVEYGDGMTEKLALELPEKTFDLLHTYKVRNTYSVEVVVTDEGRKVGRDSINVTVDDINTPPIPVYESFEVDDDGELSASGSFTDPDSKGWSGIVTFGDSTSEPLILQPNKTFFFLYKFSAPRNYEVTVTITDDLEAEGSVSKTARVKDNGAPTFDLGPDIEIEEGDGFTRSYSFADPDSTSWTATVYYGEGPTLVLMLDDENKTFSLTHTYRDDGEYPVAVAITDNHNKTGHGQMTVTASPVEPKIGPLPSGTINAGDIFPGFGSFTDPGDDDWTVTVDFGDGSPPLDIRDYGADKFFELDHLYTNGGEYTITVTVRDIEDGLEDSDTTTVLVNTPPCPNFVGARMAVQVPDSSGNPMEDLVDSVWARHGTDINLVVSDPCSNASANQRDISVVQFQAEESGESLYLQLEETGVNTSLFDGVFRIVDDNEQNTTSSSPDTPADGDGSLMARISTLSFDELTVAGVPGFGISVENVPPQFVMSLSPGHHDVLDDVGVELITSVADDQSRIPEPDDDFGDGDAKYNSVVFLLSDTQCADRDGIGGGDGLLFKSNGEKKTLQESLSADCDGDGSPDITVLETSKSDYDYVIDGETTVEHVAILSEGIHYIGAIAFDLAGNHAIYDGIGDELESLSEITIVQTRPEIDIVRTGVRWDGSQNRYVHDRSFIQVIFQSPVDLDPDSIDEDDFVIEGHVVKRVQWFGIEPEEMDGGPLSGNPRSQGPQDIDGERLFVCSSGGTTVSCTVDGAKILRPASWITWEDPSANRPEDNKFAMMRNSVFIQLQDELDTDETPMVHVVPDGVDDAAGNSADNDQMVAEDFISPGFTVLQLTSRVPPDASGNVVAGSGDEVEIIVTSDEDLSDRPNVALIYVECRDFETECSTAMTSYTGADVTDIGTNRWRIMINPLRRTGYHSVYIFGKDGSPNQNLGGVGISPSIISDGAGRGFFMPDGTINGNAFYFEVDLELPNPQVLIGGKNAKDSPNIEFVNPLFIQIDFTKPFDPDSSQDHESLTEGGEYHGDNFDEAVITLFALDGFNMTHQVSTTDGRRFLVGIDNISLGAHSILLNAMDEAGNNLMSPLFIEFEIFEPPPFEITLLPGWNLVSFPAEPLDPDMNAVFSQGVPVTTVYTFDPSVPGGWVVAVRGSPDDPWFGDLKKIDPERGFWVLSDEIYELQVDLEAVSVGSYDLAAGWNLIGVSVSGDSPEMDVKQYLSSIQSEWGSIQHYDTILARWLKVDGIGPSPPDSLGFPGLPPSDPIGEFGTVAEGKAYLIFVESAVVLVPP